tara:strand:+ start:1010 stop:1279 length:270 start_codon:yes stop_codon:yes gene_type:complete
MDELRIDEELLHKCIQQVTVGDYQHRGIKGLLEMIAMAGYRWRTPVKIVLYNSSHDKEADFDEDYNAYLDRKACGENITWAEHDTEMKE